MVSYVKLLFPDFETQLKVNEEKLESQKEENAKLAEELSSLKQM